MKQDILIRVIRGEATPEENRLVLDWIKKSDENLNYFSELKMLWVISSTPDKLAGEEDLIDFKNKTPRKFSTSLTGHKFWFGFGSAVSAAIIIVLLGVLFGLINFQNSNQRDKNESANLSLSNQMSMYTDKGVKGKVVLPDGSVVWLNSDSKIVYPDNFAKDKREVEIYGEAYFEVTKDTTRPMIVHTAKGFAIQVLGTKFSVKSYENDLESKAVLYNGSIRLITNSKKDREEVVLEMKPNDCAIITEDGTAKLTRIDKTNDIAWLKGEIVFENTPMSEVLKVIERWYGKNFNVKDSSLYNYKLNATFKSESLIQILDIISLCTSVKYKIEEENVIFQ
ncbi:MAG: FecR family protein [Bacteroidales bacterium]|nr:FecR family protein [Bacteroidales bacterium]